MFFREVMMNRIYMMLIFFLGVFFVGSISCVVDTGSLDYLASITDSDRDADDRSRIGRRKFSRSSNQCEDSERCENICDQILDYSKERRNCYGLSLKEIGKIEDVFDVLKEDTVNRLDDIRGGDFDLFASIALSSWSNLIRGEYRRDEEDDDDEDDDDTGPEEYDPDKAKAVLDWLIRNKSIAESVRDFSGRDNHILADLLVRLPDTLDCSGSGDRKAICDELKDSSLTVDQKKILAGAKSNLPLAVVLSSSDKEVSAMYELTHDLLSRVCEDVDSMEINSKNYGRDHSYKICLSWTYFCPSSIYDDTNTNTNTSNQIDQYLLKDTYRKNVEGDLKDCDFIGNDVEWSDYWN